jgi:hypothetical protein
VDKSDVFATLWLRQGLCHVGLMSSGDDRPKKTWREIDAARSGSSHHGSRSDVKRGGRPVEQSREYRAYKTKLDKLFSGSSDAIPEGIKDKLLESDFGAKARDAKAIEKSMLAAVGEKAILASLAEYEKTHGFPTGEVMLMKLLEITDEEVLGKVLSAIWAKFEEKSMHTSVALRTRLSTVKMLVDDPYIHDAADALLRM